MLISIYLVLTVAVEVFICVKFISFESFTGIIVALLSLIGIFIGFILLHFLIVAVVALFTTKKDTDRPRRFYKFTVERTVEMMLMFLGVKTKINGIEKLPVDRRFLFVSNHLKNYDPMILMVPLRKYDIAFVSKPENFKIPLVGTFVRQCSYMTIDRENPRNAMKTLHRATELIKNGNVSVGIYPEGTRSKTGELLEFKDGVFYVAKKSPCPIAVSTVKYEKLSFGRTLATVDILEVIEPEEFETLATHEISDRVRDIMLKNKA